MYIALFFFNNSEATYNVAIVYILHSQGTVSNLYQNISYLINSDKEGFQIIKGKWLATCKKGHLDIFANCHVRSAWLIRNNTFCLYLFFPF